MKRIKTPFDQLREAMERHWCQPLGGKSAFSDEQLDSIRAMAAELPLKDIEEDVPLTDGELMKAAWINTGSGPLNYDTVAAEFLRLIRERDGEPRDIAQEQISALVNFLSQEGTNRPLSLKHPVGSAIRYIEELEKTLAERDGEPLEVTAKLLREAHAPGISWQEYADSVNAHRGVRSLPTVTAELCRNANRCGTFAEMADYINAALAKAKDGES